MKTFIKPVLNLPMFPIINMRIVSDYSKVKTFTDFVDFINDCLSVAEVTTNEARRQAYLNVASVLYSMETNISYESKQIELLTERL